MMQIDLPNDLIEAARALAAQSGIPLEKQIELWTRRGMAVELALRDDATPDQIAGGPT